MNCRSAAMLQHHRSCAALWNEKFTFGTRQYSCFSFFFFFFASEGSSLGEPVLFPSQPLGCLHLGQCCFWLEEAKIYDAHFTLGILGLWSQELIWFVSLQVLKWGQVTYLSDVFKGESSLLCQPHSALCVLALVQARAVCGVGCLHFDSKLYRS